MKLLHARLALAAIAGREIHKFLRQPGRLASYRRSRSASSPTDRTTPATAPCADAVARNSL